VVDRLDALFREIDDFRAMPATNVVFVSLIYPVVGLILGRATLGYELMPLLFPLIAGFALLGPFAAVWVCELSRRRELGLDVSRRHAFDIFRSRSFGPVVAFGCLLIAIFLIWIALAQSLYVANFGYGSPTFS